MKRSLIGASFLVISAFETVNLAHNLILIKKLKNFSVICRRDSLPSLDLYHTFIYYIR